MTPGCNIWYANICWICFGPPLSICSQMMLLMLHCCRIHRTSSSCCQSQETQHVKSLQTHWVLQINPTALSHRSWLTECAEKELWFIFMTQISALWNVPYGHKSGKSITAGGILCDIGHGSAIKSETYRNVTFFNVPFYGLWWKSKQTKLWTTFDNFAVAFVFENSNQCDISQY